MLTQPGTHSNASDAFNITIVGLGLIGGSLAVACRKAFPKARIVGVTRNRQALAKARQRRWIHEGTKDLARGVKSADLIILCTPVDTLKDYLKRIDALAKPGTTVTDAGSAKGFIVRWADKQRFKRISFVGAHPMAGSHERGIDAAKENLFKDALTFITPGKRNARSSVRLVKEFWKKISGRTMVISPEEHDRLTAEISHFPHLLATVLVSNALPRSLRVAAAGFLDTTRIAQGDPVLWAPILLENQKEMDKVIQRFTRELAKARKTLKRRDFSGLKRFLTHAQKRRRTLE